MKNKIRSESIAIIKYMLIVIVVIVLIYSVYSFLIIRSSITSIESNLALSLEEISKKQSEVVKEQIQLNIKDISVIRDLYNRNEGYDLEKEINNFNLVSRNYMTITYSDVEGNIMIGDKSKATDENISGTNFYKKAIEGKEYLVKQVDEEGNVVLVYAAPLEKNGEITGVILAWIDIHILDEILNNTIFDGLGYFALLDEEGNILVHKDENLIGQKLENILHKENIKEQVNVFTTYLNNKDSKTMKMITSGIENYLSITSIEEFNTVIHLVSFVDADYIGFYIDEITFDLYLSLTVSLILFIGVSIYILYQRKKYINKVNNIVYRDVLTGGFNYNYLLVALENDNLGDRALIYFSIKNFSNINELFGVETGNLLITYIYEKIKELLPKDVFVRDAGSKFIIVKKYNSKEEVKELVEIINSKVKQFVTSNNLRFDISIIAGICYNINISEIEKHINNANLARTFIKSDAESIYKEFDEKIIEIEKQKLEIETDIKESLEKGYFQVYYQSKIDSRINKVIGAEALVRMIHKEKGIISPGKFIPVAEQTGYINLIDKEVFKLVCRDLNELIRNNIKIVPISVNLSRNELLDNSMIKYIEKQIEIYDIPREYIEFEVTESMAIENLDILCKLLDELKSKGYKIMIDDFGTRIFFI